MKRSRTIAKAWLLLHGTPRPTPISAAPRAQAGREFASLPPLQRRLRRGAGRLWQGRGRRQDRRQAARQPAPAGTGLVAGRPESMARPAGPEAGKHPLRFRVLTALA